MALVLRRMVKTKLLSTEFQTDHISFHYKTTIHEYQELPNPSQLDFDYVDRTSQNLEDGKSTTSM